MINDETLDVTAAAERLGTSLSAVRKAIARGTLRATSVAGVRGPKYVILASELARYGAEHRTVRGSR